MNIRDLIDDASENRETPSLKLGQVFVDWQAQWEESTARWNEMLNPPKIDLGLQGFDLSSLFGPSVKPKTCERCEAKDAELKTERERRIAAETFIDLLIEAIPEIEERSG